MPRVTPCISEDYEPPNTGLAPRSGYNVTREATRLLPLF